MLPHFPLVEKIVYMVVLTLALFAQMQMRGKGESSIGRAIKDFCIILTLVALILVATF